MSKTYGQVAYEAFGDCRGWKSITGYPLPSWDELESLKHWEWSQIALAVIQADDKKAVEGEEEPNEEDDTTDTDQPD